MEKDISNKSGFAIIEILISLALVSFALIAIVAVFPRMVTHRKVISEADIANIVALEELERIQRHFELLDFEIASDTNGYNNLVFPNAPPPCRIGVTKCEYKYKIISSSPTNQFNRVEVTVNWTKGGKPRGVSLMGVIK